MPTIMGGRVSHPRQDRARLRLRTHSAATHSGGERLDDLRAPKSERRRSRRKSTRTMECARSKPRILPPHRDGRRGRRERPVMNVMTLVKPCSEAGTSRQSPRLGPNSSIPSRSQAQRSPSVLRQTHAFHRPSPSSLESRKEPNRQSIPGLWTTQVRSRRARGFGSAEPFASPIGALFPRRAASSPSPNIVGDGGDVAHRFRVRGHAFDL